ncbi:hypothetical protein P9139_17450 [Curtobacterium flaccumfaciens]|nr:hypothetical protein P9139_17450 [Curtobacterium flaccumfaciens]
MRPASSDRSTAHVTTASSPVRSATARVQAVMVMRSSGRHGAATTAAPGSATTGWSAAKTGTVAMPSARRASEIDVATSGDVGVPGSSSVQGSAPGRSNREP